MSETIEFFTARKDELTELLNSLIREKPEEDTDKEKTNLATELIKLLTKNTLFFDNNCQFNIKHIGNEFDSVMRHYAIRPDFRKQNKEKIITNVFRLIVEAEYKFHNGNDILYKDLTKLKDQILNNIETFTDVGKAQISFAAYSMIYYIIREKMESSDIKTFSDFKKTANECSELDAKITSSIEEHKKDIDAASKLVEKIKTEANFVGLSAGFSGLKQKKEDELSSLKTTIRIFGALIIIPLILEICFLYQKMATGELKIEWMAITIPLVALELFLLYFFRISLTSAQEIKGQLLQLELRVNLCQFIQSYSDYSKEIKAKDGKALEKFENLIFSPILMDGAKIPATFDGLDQITKLISTVRTKAP